MAKRSSVTSYIKNLGKSLGYAAYDAIGDYTPVTKGIIEATKTTFQEAKASMKEIAGSGTEKAKSFTSDVLSNTLEDLKSGNWYNKKRMDSDMFGDFDFDDDFGDFEDWGDEDVSGSDASVDAITANDDANTRKVISSMGKVSGNLSKSIGYASARNAEYIVAHTRASNAALYNLNAKGFNQVSNILLNMDNTMAGIAKIGQPLSNFMENSFTFYTNTTNSLNKINESLDKLVERTAMLDPKAKKDRSAKGSYGSIFTGGMFDASAYADMVKSNIKEISEMAKGIGSMISMMSGGMSGKNTLSLTSMILKGGLQLMMPGMTKESLKQFDKALSNAIGRGFRQMRKNASGNILVDLLAGIFAPKQDFSRTVSTRDYEKGPVPWDGVARKALVEVIPTYLAKLNAILGGDEKYYDYEEGKFVSVQDIRKKRSEMDNNAALAAGGDFRREIIKDAAGDKKIEREVENFFREAFLNGKDISLAPYLASPSLLAADFRISTDAAKRIINTYHRLQERSKQGKANKYANTYSDWANDVYVGRSDLHDRYRNLAGTDDVILNLFNGNIAEIPEEKKGKGRSLGKASERLADKYNGSISVALSVVIPEYLQAIHGILNDGQSFTYDYNSGKFRPLDTRKHNARRFNNLRTPRGGSESKADIADITAATVSNDGSTVTVTFDGQQYELTTRQYDGFLNLPNNEKAQYLKSAKAKNVTDQYAEKIKNSKAGKGISSLLGKARRITEIPGALASQGIDKVTNWLNSLFWGDKKQAGIFSRFGTFLGNKFGGFLDKDNRLMAKAVKEIGLPPGTADIIVEKVDDVKVYIAVDRTGNRIGTVDKKTAKEFFKKHSDLYNRIYNKRIAGLPQGTVDIIVEHVGGGKVYTCLNIDGDKIGTVSEDVAEKFYNKKGIWASIKHEFGKLRDRAKDYLFGGSVDEYIEDANAHYNGTAARGRRITRSGIAIVSEGEMIIPSEYNPFYHGRTNKAYQIANESRIARRNGLLGVPRYAEGADVASTEPVSEEDTKKASKFGAATKIAGDVARTAGEGLKKLFMSLTAGVETDKEKVFDGLRNGLKKIGDNKGAIGLGAITGAGVSLLTGAVVGPLGGAAIGAAAGLVAKSTALQDVLFGKGDPESDEYQEGILGALGKAIKKDKKGAIGGAIGAAAGGIVGQFVMGSPVVGAIVGAAGGFISQSKTAQDFLFGENNEKALGQLKETLKKKFPNIAVGALAGAVLGPFGGVLPNMLVGAGMGFLTTQDRFQHFMFGDPNDPKNKHGLMGKINDIVHNLSNAVQGFIKRMGTRINDWFKKIGTSIRDRIDSALKKYAQEKADGTGLGGFLGKLAGGLATIGEKGILAPVSLVQGGLRRHNLRRGNAVYDRELGRNMTSLERVAYAKNKHVSRGVYGQADEYLASLNNEEFAKLAGMSGEDIRSRLRENGVNVKKNAQLSQIRALIGEENKLRQKNASALKESQLNDPNYANILDIKHILMAKFKIKTDNNGNVQVDNSTNANRVSAAIMDEEQKAKQRSRLARRWAAKLNRQEADGEKSEDNEKTEYTPFGVVQLRRNNQGEWVEAIDDKETGETLKSRKSFLDSLASLGPLGEKLAAGLGWFKKKLFGDEEDDEKKEGLMDKIKKWFNLDDENSWIMSFLGKAKTVLKNIIPGGIMATIGIGALTGLFDKAFQKFVDILPWNRNKNTSTNGTSVSGNNITTLTNEQGDIIGSVGSDASLSTVLKNNLFSRLLMGFGMGGPTGSVGGGLLKWGLNGIGRIFGGKEAKWGTKLFGGLASFSDAAAAAGKSTFLGAHSFADLDNPEVLLNMINDDDAMKAFSKSDDLINLLKARLAEGLANLLKALKKIAPDKFNNLISHYGVNASADDVAAELAKAIASKWFKGANPAKLSKALKNLKSAGTVLAIIYAVARALQGWDTAENVLGITRTATVGERWVSALIAGINAAIPFVGDLLTDKQIVDIGLWLAGLMGIDTSGIESDREKAIREVDAYNEEHGTNLTVEAYNRAGLGAEGKLGTGGLFTTYGEYINTFKERKAEGGWGAAFKGIGEDISARFTEGYDKSIEEHGSVIRATFDGVGQVMEQILPGTVGEVNQKIAEILGAAEDGDLKGVWSATLSKFGWDTLVEKPTSPVEKVLGFIAWVLGQSTIFPWKVTQTIPALFAMLRNNIDPGRNDRHQGILKGIDLMKSNWEDFLEGAAAGKSIKELLNDTDQFDNDEENPLGGTMKAVLNVQRLVFIPSVLLGRAGAAISQKFNDIMTSVKSSAEGVKRVYDDGMRMLEQGHVDTKTFFDIKAMKEDPDNPLHGIFYAAAGAARLVTVPVFIMKKVGSTVKDVFDTMFYTAQSAVPDLQEDDKLMRDLVAKGNVRGLWNVDFTFNDSEHNILAPLMKPINFFQRVSYTIPALFSKAGHAIADLFQPMIDNAKDAWGNLSSYRETVAQLADEGDVRGVLMSSVVDASDIVGTKLNPIASIAYSTSNIIKVGGVARALFTKAGNGIKDIINSDAMESSHKAYDRAIEALKTAEESGSMKQIMAVKFANSTTAQSRKSPFTGFFGFGFTVVKIGHIFKQLMKNLAESFEDITDKIMDIAEESPIVKAAMKVGSFVSNMAEGWSNIKNQAKTQAEAAYAETSGEGSRLPRGGDSGFVSQFDPRYKNYKIAGQSFGAKGCGPAVAAMAARAMGRPMSVGQAMQYSSGYQTPDGVTLDYFQNALGSQGLNTEVITGGSSQDMYTRIAAGQKMVLLGRDPSNTSKEYSPFGPNNHYVLATGVDRRGNVIINDPEGKGPKAYNPNILRSASYGIAGGGTRRAKRPRRTITNLRAKFRIAGGSTLDTDVAQAVWSFFKARGYSEPAIAGIMGNMQSESGMIPSRIQGDGTGPAAGIVQWENYNTQSGRWKAMADYAASKERDWTDLESQLEFVDMEMRDPGSVFWSGSAMAAAGVAGTTLEAFKQSTNVEQATREFEGAFERAGIPHMEARIENARAFYQLYTGKTTDDSALTNYTPIGTSALTSYSGGVDGGVSGGITGATTEGTKKKREWTAGNVFNNVVSVFSDAFSNFFNPKDSTSGNYATVSSDGTLYGTTDGSTTGYTTGGALGSTAGVNGDMANGFPYYNQKASPWGPTPYGHYPGATTYGAAACGPTTAAMIMKSYNAAVGSDPISAGEFAIAKGDRPPTNTGTAGTIFKHLGDENGLIVNPINKDQAVELLGKRIPIAALMGPGDFTGGGHYIAFTGTHNGHVVVNDPNSVDKTGKQWSPNVLNQALSLWSITGSNGEGSIRYGAVKVGDVLYAPDGTEIKITSIAQDGSVVTSNMKVNKMLSRKGGWTGEATFQDIQQVIDGVFGGADLPAPDDPLAPMDGSDVAANPKSNKNIDNISAAGSGLVSSYSDIARRAGGSSGLLLRSRVGSRNNAKVAPSRRMRPQPRRIIAGGASEIADLATSYLNNAQVSISNAGNAGTISPELVAQLLSSITALLESIANNTAPVAQIYSALRAYMQAGGGTHEEEVNKVTPVNNHPSGAGATDDTVDANIQSLVGVLAQLAKG